MADKEIVRTERAPAPFQGAPYNQAVKAAGLVFIAGQLGLKPGDKEPVQGIAEQTEQVMQNLCAILEEAGAGLDRLVKTTVFLQNLGDFAAMNEVYAAHVGDAPPARSTVEVSTFLPSMNTSPVIFWPQDLPKRLMANSVRPEPISPAIPTTSPFLRLISMFLITCRSRCCG